MRTGFGGWHRLVAAGLIAVRRIAPLTVMLEASLRHRRVLTCCRAASGVSSAVSEMSEAGRGPSHTARSKKNRRLRLIVERRTSMATRAPFLKTRYGGYYHREVPDEDAELTHVGPGTPCGEYMRRFWQPVCFSDELRDLPL